jgi:aspartate/methionine/tyrosine aminotransferase
MAWARRVPGSSTINLTASGMADFLGEGETPASFGGALEVASLSSRARAPEVHAEFCAAVGERYGVDPVCVTPTLGSSQAIMHAMFAWVRAGDHVIVERPTYEPLHRVPELLGANVSRLERKFDEDFQLVPDRLAQLLTPRTRAVVLSNLHNPSGVAASTQSLEAVAEMAARVGAVVMVDEVYLDYAFDPSGATGSTPACLTVDNSISWSSTTKAFGFGALRAGWIVSRNAGCADAMAMASHYLQVDMPLASLELATRVLRNSEVLEARAHAATAAGRQIVADWVSREERIAWVDPSAGASCVIRLPELVSDQTFAEHLRSAHDTQVVPGSFFGAPGLVRLSFAIDAEPLERGLANFSAALDHFA